MFRRRGDGGRGWSAPVGAAVVVCALLGAMAAGGIAHAAESGTDPATEAVEQYLEDLRLDPLLAAYLEHRLGETSGRERVDVAEELAAVYTRLLESAKTLDEQQKWEGKSRDLLVAAPEADSLDLRIGLARASYKRAEEVAEKWRLRLVKRDEVVAAAARLKDLIDRFDQVADEANRRVRSLEKQEETAPDASQELLQAALGEARRQRSLSHYLAGWAATHVAQINNDGSLADVALTHLGWLLNAKPNARAELERLPEQLLKYPHVARAAIAAAVCEAVRGKTDDALAWLDKVEGGEDLAEGIVDQVFSRRIEILAHAERWGELGEVVATKRGSGAAGEDEGRATPLPVTDARLLAVLTFEAKPTQSADLVEHLRDIALGDLVARGELGHVLDLASLYGAESFGDQSFVSQQVRGLMIYNAAREAHKKSGVDENDPVEDPKIATQYLQAATLFEHAIKSKDAADFTGALGNTMMLIGLCEYYAGGAPEGAARRAADWFIDAAARVPEADRAANALWMAIRTLDMEVERGVDASGALAKERDGLIDRFLKEYPDNPRAAALTLRLATSGNVSEQRAIELLLAVPEGSELYETARRHAARMSYEMYRKAPASDRDWRGLRYLELAEPLLASDRRRASAGDKDAARLVSVRARRIAEVSLGTSVPDVERADRALDVLMSLINSGLVEPSGVLLAEIDFRRAQIALERGDEAKAEEIVDRLAQEDSKYASAGRRMVYRHALTTWRRLERGDPKGERALDAARMVVKHGRALVDELASGKGAMEDPAVASLCVSVGDAAADLALYADDRESGELALDLYQRVLAVHPATGATLHRMAEVAEKLGKDELALDSWRRLLAGLEDGSSDWFEAKYHQVALLMRLDQGRARAVLEQLAVLYPDFGPEPWGGKLRGLHEELTPGAGTGGSP